MRRPVLLVGGVALVTVLAGIAVAASAGAGTTTYEAEDPVNTLRGGAHAVECRRCSGGSRITGVGLLGSLTFTGVVAETAGATRLAVTYTGAQTRTAEISVNGGAPTAVRFPGTRGENRPATLRVRVTLRAGGNALTFGNPAGPAPDIDKLVITTDGTPPTPAPTATTPIEPGPSATAPPTGHAAFEAEVVTIVNAERAKAGCAALTVDDRLTAAARGHSADMAARGYFNHVTPDGVEFAARFTAAGYRWSAAGENIAKGHRNPQDVMSNWMNSAGHRANILNCAFTNLGVGVAADAEGALLWTQDLGSPRRPKDQAPGAAQPQDSGSPRRPKDQAPGAAQPLVIPA